MKRAYLNDRWIEERPEGYVVITPKECSDPIPLCCRVCDHAMRSHDDEVAYEAFGCCDRCARLWAHPRREEWKAGWRPDPEQVKAAEHDRLPLALTFIVD